MQDTTDHEGENVVHSVHTTNRDGVVRVLVTAKNAAPAQAFFNTLHEVLRTAISAEDFHTVTKGLIIQVTDKTFESQDSKTYTGSCDAKREPARWI